jgi:hypothetical protein
MVNNAIAIALLRIAAVTPESFARTSKPPHDRSRVEDLAPLISEEARWQRT